MKISREKLVKQRNVSGLPEKTARKSVLDRPKGSSDWQSALTNHREPEPCYFCDLRTRTTPRDLLLWVSHSYGRPLP